MGMSTNGLICKVLADHVGFDYPAWLLERKEEFSKQKSERQTGRIVLDPRMKDAAGALAAAMRGVEEMPADPKVKQAAAALAAAAIRKVTQGKEAKGKEAKVP